MPDRIQGKWHQCSGVNAFPYRCGYCDASVGPDKGYVMAEGNSDQVSIRICPVCNRPSFFAHNEQHPQVAFGEAVKNVPAQVEALYNEARRCTAAGAHTAAVLTARKLLMHIAVDQKAPEGDSFIQYVEYLADNGFVPPHGKGWVDYIRIKGNEANHEIVLMGQKDAQDLLIFLVMLLKFIYELPSYIPKAPSSS
ncbi:MAG: DUF4145 domain-containing protein [Deltaproteobacteria bacterium]|nr:DUF4145 domain-containing protein [Deltaproteobacteria bacterium]